MLTENLSTLKIHRLTQEQYNRELAAGRIDENAIYLTPDNGVNGGSSPSINYIETKTVYLGEDVLGSAILGDGWVKSEGVYTHSAGYDADLTFETTVEDGSIYILEFDTSYTGGEFVRVGIGDQYRVLCYNGTSHISVPLLASGGTTLYITPIATTYAGSISNIVLRKIQETGEEYILTLYNTTTSNHLNNYGFWNNFIGKDVAENAVSSTRCIGIGHQTLKALQGGNRNIGIGTFAMSQLIGGEANVSIGSDSMLAVQEATECVAIGMSAMYNCNTSTNNIAIGRSALYGANNSNPQSNISLGSYAGYKVTTAKENIFIGNNSGYNTTSGYCNTFIGSGAAKAVTTGYFNTAIGRNTVIPASARNCVVVGDGATATKSYQAVLGADNITETLLKGNLVVSGTDGVKRQIVFNADGTVGWVTV